LALLILELASQWRKVSDSIHELSVFGIIASAVFTVLAVGTTVLSWRALLAGLGARLPLRAAVRIFFVGQVGKYIPGSVWPVLAQMELSRDYGVDRPKSASASLVVLALAVPAGGIAAVATLPFVSRSALTHYGWALAAVPVFMIVLHPAVLSRLLAFAFRRLRRPPLTEPLRLATIMVGAGWLLVSFVLYGIATWFVLRDLQPDVHGIRLLALAIGAYSLAWTAGFLVLVVPAGAGVREAVLTLALAPALASGPALLVAVVARLLATIADLIWAAIGVALRPRGTVPSVPADGASPTPPGPGRTSAGQASYDRRTRFGAEPTRHESIAN